MTGAACQLIKAVEESRWRQQQQKIEAAGLVREELVVVGCGAPPRGRMGLRRHSFRLWRRRARGREAVYSRHAEPAEANDSMETLHVESQMWRLSHASARRDSPTSRRSAIKWLQHQLWKLYSMTVRCWSGAMLNVATAWQQAVLTGDGISVSTGGKSRTGWRKMLRRGGVCFGTEEVTSMGIPMTPMRTAHVTTAGGADRGTRSHLETSCQAERTRVKEELHTPTLKRSQWRMEADAVKDMGCNLMKITGLHLFKGVLGMRHVVDTEGGIGNFTTAQVLNWEVQDFEDHQARDRGDDEKLKEVDKPRKETRKGACGMGTRRKTRDGGACTALAPSASVKNRRAVEVEIRGGAVCRLDPRRLLHPTGSCHGKGDPSGNTCRTSTVTLEVKGMAQASAAKMSTALGMAPREWLAEAARLTLSHKGEARTLRRARWTLDRGRASVPWRAYAWSGWPLAVSLVNGPPTKFEGEATRLGRGCARPRRTRASERTTEFEGRETCLGLPSTAVVLLAAAVESVVEVRRAGTDVPLTLGLSMHRNVWTSGTPPSLGLSPTTRSGSKRRRGQRTIGNMFLPQSALPP